MGSRIVQFDEKEFCDCCGKRGANDFMGDLLCDECASDEPIFIEVADKPCSTHKEHSMGYVERHEWAEKKIKQGHKQKRCDQCGYWYFKCEF